MPDLAFTEAELERLADLLAERVAAKVDGARREPEGLVTITAAGRMIGCHRRTVRRRIDDGTLPAVVEHGRTMLRVSEIRAYVEGLDRPGSAPARPRRPRAARGRFDFLRE